MSRENSPKCCRSLDFTFVGTMLFTTRLTFQAYDMSTGLNYRMHLL